MNATHHWLDNLPSHRLPDELAEVVHSSSTLRIEKIISTGQSSPPGFWYDQKENEWVLLLTGEASLQIEGEAKPRELRAGDSVFLPAGQRHRVESTSEQPAVWLAIFYNDRPTTE